MFLRKYLGLGQSIQPAAVVEETQPTPPPAPLADAAAGDDLLLQLVHSQIVVGQSSVDTNRRQHSSHRVNAVLRYREALHNIQTSQALQRCQSYYPTSTDVFVGLALQELNRLVDTMSYEELCDAFGCPDRVPPQGGDGGGGLLLRDLQNLPTRQVDAKLATDLSNFACPVCLDHAHNGDTLRILPCQHFFHAGCIDSWLSRSKNCPVCRRSSKQTTPPPSHQG